MKINIVYQKHSDVDAPCIAKTEIMGEELLAIGKTWDEARTRLIAKVTAWTNANVPAPESVWVESKDEEMEMPELLPTSFLQQISQTKDGIPWGPEETTTKTVRRAKVHFEGGQIVKPEDREIGAGQV
jgi:hypothetical protein